MIKINIGEDVLDNAKFVACKVEDDYLRKRVYALGIAANATAKYLTENGLKTHSSHSLYKSAVFAKEIEIADIYANNARFDVRVTFNDKTFTVPKLQVKYDIKPQAYIVVRFDNSLKDFEFLGFIPESELEYDKNGQEYYTYPLDLLKPFEEFIPYAEGLNITPKKYSDEEHDNILSLCVSILDEQADEADKIYFIKHVANCTQCRDTFCDINDFDDIVSQLKNYHELLNDSTLSVLSGNREEVDQAAIAHMALVENASEDFIKEIEKTAEEAAASVTMSGALSAAAAGQAADSILAAQAAEEPLEPMVLNMYDAPESSQGTTIADKNIQDETLDSSESLLLEDTDLEVETNNTNSAQAGNSTLLLANENAVVPELSVDENIIDTAAKEQEMSQEVSNADISTDSFLVEDNLTENSFDELNASIEEFAGEPLEDMLQLESDDEVAEDKAEEIQKSEEEPLNLQLSDDSEEENLVPQVAVDVEAKDSLNEQTSIEGMFSDELSLDLDEPEPLAVSDDDIFAQDEISAAQDGINLEENTQAADNDLQLDSLSDDSENTVLPQEDSISLDIETEQSLALDDLEDFSKIHEPEILSEELEEAKEMSVDEHTEEKNVEETAQNVVNTADLDELTLGEDDDLSQLNDSDSLELDNLAAFDEIGEPAEEKSVEEAVQDTINISDSDELPIPEDDLPQLNDSDSLGLDNLAAFDETEEPAEEKSAEKSVQDTINISDSDELPIPEDDFPELNDSDSLELDNLAAFDEIEESSEEKSVEESAQDTINISDFDELSISEDDFSELNGSDSLELDDLETIDEIEPQEDNFQAGLNMDNTPEQNNVDSDFGLSDDGLTDFKEEDTTEDVWVASSQPQEPVELKYDDEEPEQISVQNENQTGFIEDDVFDINKQEPVIESFDNDTEEHVSDFDFPDYNYENMQTDNAESSAQQDLSQEQPVQTGQNINVSVPAASEAKIQGEDSDEEDLQELLDDDLLALLSDEDSEGKENQEDEQSAEPSAFVDTENSETQDGIVLPEEDALLGQETEHTSEIAENEEIENLFDEQEAPQEGEQVELDLSQEPMSAEAVKKTKKLAIAGALIALLAIGGIAGGYYIYQKNTAAVNNDSADAAQDNQVFDFQNSAVQGEEQDISSGAVSQDINKSMTNSFSDKPAAISITKLSWQVNEKLAVEPSVKEYLQTAGKNIQLNLQNDLANAADVAFNNSVKVSFEIAPDNTLKGIQVLESSGSDKIDAIITKSIKNTLKYVSVPKLQNYKSDYFLTLIINF